MSLRPLSHSLQCHLNVWYLNDGTLGGTLEGTIAAVKVVQESSIFTGLKLNHSKCEVFISNFSDEGKTAAMEELSVVLPGIRNTGSPDLCLLGAPLTDAAIPKCLDDKQDCATRSSMSMHTTRFFS